MQILTTTVARILFAIPFLAFGLMHFANNSTLATYVLGGWPMAGILVYLAGLCSIAAGVSVIIKKYDRLAMLLLAALMIIYVLAIHLPAVMADPNNQGAMSGMLKDIGLAGGALAFAGIAQKEGR